MICPLSPAHFVALGSFQIFVLLLFINATLAFLPLFIFILLCFSAPLFPCFSFFLPIICRGGRGAKGVALTFDDGPDPDVTPKLLELLKHQGVTATFFVTGARAERYPDIIKAILDDGHTVGNHSYSHSPFLMLKGCTKLEQEIVSAQNVFRQFGIVPLAFRPPVGITNSRLWRILLENGMFCLNFSLRARDFGNRRVTGLGHTLMLKAQPGDIILLHDITPRHESVEYLLKEFSALIEGLKGRGLEILPLGSLIGKEVMQRSTDVFEPNPAEQFYNGLAATYDQEQFASSVSLSRLTEYRLFTARLSTLFAGANRVLEIGAGTGIFTLDIARNCSEVIAADISGNMLELLEKKAIAEGIENIRTLKGDVETIEIKGPFSLVCAFSSLEYLVNLPAFFARIAPQIEPGGVVYLITARRSLFRLFTQIGNAMRQGLWLKAHSSREIESMLTAAGFEQITISSHLLKSFLSGGMLLEVVARRSAKVEVSALPVTLSVTEAGQPETVPETLVLVPVFNHAKSLRGVVEGILAEGFPILVIDDGSSDGSLDTVSDLPVRRHRLPVNIGKGGAILAGLQIARTSGFQALITIDADGQHDPPDAKLLLQAASSSWPCIVIGERRMETLNVPRSSLFGRDFSNFWVRLETGQTLPDTQSGYRLYPVEFLESFRFISRRYTFEIEVLVRGLWAGLPVLSTPVQVYYPPGNERVSHFHKLKDNLRLSCLHTFLVIRSLIPWPHRRLFQGRNESITQPGIFKPIQYLKALSLEHSSAAELAAAVWVGIFLGALPIIPFGIAAIVYATHRLHLNKLAAVGASNLCCAPFVPFLCIELGHYLIHGSFWYQFNRQTLLNEIHYRLWEWLLGALLIGPILGLIGALLTYSLVNMFRKQSRETVATVQNEMLRNTGVR